MAQCTAPRKQPSYRGTASLTGRRDEDLFKLQAVNSPAHIRLLSLDQVGEVSEKAAELIKLMNNHARPMIA